MVSTPVKHPPKRVVPPPAPSPSKTTTPSFSLKDTQSTIAELHRPIDERHLKTLTKGKGDNAKALPYCPWSVVCKSLHHRAPGWGWELLEVKELGGYVVVSGRLTIATSDGVLHYCGVASEALDSASYAPPVESAASGALRRAAALAGLGLDLYLS